MKKSSATRRLRLLLHDRAYSDRGFQSLAGVDEAGRGPLAGPVVASAVIVRDFSFSCAIDDSKKMTPRARERAYAEIFQNCRVGVGIVERDAIDRMNILQAALRAMADALESLSDRPDCVLVDGPRLPRMPFYGEALVSGDARSFSVACASIVAKVTRDRLMDEWDARYPEYGFRRHKGYGTREHLDALRRHGPCAIHRMSFAPVKHCVRSSVT